MKTVLNFRKAEKSEVKLCTEMAKRSFWDYRYFSVFCDNEQEKESFLSALFSAWLNSSQRRGSLYLIEEEGAPAAMAVLDSPHDKRPGRLDMLLSGWWRLYLSCGFSKVRRFFKMSERGDAPCHNLPDPKYYLALFAVDSKLQGRGIGRRALNECIFPYIAEKGGGLLTLNTNTEPNRLFYKRNGFEEFFSETINENGKAIGCWSYKINIPVSI